MGQLTFQATLGGQVNLVGPNTASTYNINVPATSGNMVTTGDSATVTSGMLASTTGSGAVVLASSPTLVTPALGTPSALVGTNITGTAAGLSIGGNAVTATTATNVSGGTASVTTLTASSTTTLSGGTANGVAYLNGSKVVTTGSALTFDGTNLGIGAAATGFGKLDVRQSTNYRILFSGNAAYGNNGIVGITDTGSETTLGLAGTPITFYVQAAEQMRLTSTGLGIGTTSPGAKLVVAGGSAYITNTASNAAGIELAGNGNGAASTSFFLGQGSDGTAYVYQRANLNLLFGTNNTERMRLDTSGNLLVGTTSANPYPTQGLSIYGNNGGSALIGMGHATGTASGNAYMTFAYNGTGIGSITQSGTTAVLYNVTSDQRLKENIADADSASSLVDALQVRQFDWIADGSRQRYGFVAQELVTVAPEAVHQPADPEEMMAVDYSKLVPMLVKEIQSLRARVAQLESK